MGIYSQTNRWHSRAYLYSSLVSSNVIYHLLRLLCQLVFKQSVFLDKFLVFME